MIKQLRRFWIFLTLVAVIGIIWLYNADLGQTVTTNTVANFREMLLVIPPIFILLGLMDVWVPRELMLRFMGENAGLKGILLSIFLGAAAAGPLYGAFPVAATMLRKGASVRNVFIFIGSWSTLKIPMFLFETAALGALWSVIRWLASIVGILVIAFIIDRSLSPEDKQAMRSLQQNPVK